MSSNHHEIALWLYRRFRSPITVILDDDLKEETEMDRFVPVKMIRDSLQGYTGMVFDKEDRLYRCVKAASRWHLQAGRTLSDAPTRENFLGERDLMRRLSGMDDCHESICKYVDSWESTDQSFYAMEYLSNGSLLDFANDRLHGRGRPISNAVRLKVVSRIMSRIVESMEWLHSKAILHMDWSLENILMAGKGLLSPKIKIIDFGAALDFSDREGMPWTHDQWVGKPAYRVLEVAQNLDEIVIQRGYRIPYDAKSADIGTLGTILWCLLCGFYPPGDLQGIAYRGRLTEWIFFNGLQSRFDRDSLDLLNRLWTPEKNRITMKELVKHPFVTRHHSKTPSTTVTHDAMDVDMPEGSNELTRLPSDDNEGHSNESTLIRPSASLPILSRQKTIH